MKKYLCFDAGGTFIKYALIDDRENFLESGKLTTSEFRSAEDLLDEIGALYETHSDVVGIAMAMPGMIDVERGYMYTGGSLQYLKEVSFAQMVSQRCVNIPVTLENDAKAAATAELYSGALKDCKNGIVITVGTALGGTLVIDRKVLRGNNLFAGELSYAYYSQEHMFDDPPPKQIFSEACKETFWALRAGAARMCELYRSDGGDPSVTSGEQLFERIQCGDDKAATALRTCCHDLAMLLFNLQCTIDPDVIAIGGGISEQPLFIETLREETEVYRNVALDGAPRVNVVPCTYRNNANLLGAFYFHRQKTGQH